MTIIDYEMHQALQAGRYCQESWLRSLLRTALDQLDHVRANGADTEALASAIQAAAVVTKGRICALFAEAVTQVRASAPTASQAIDAAIIAATVELASSRDPN